METVDRITSFLDTLLGVDSHDDEAGLRVAGRPRVSRLAGAVDLSLNAIQRAFAAGCDMLVTHHDAWASTDADLVEKKYELLREQDVSLYVCHEPLDRHPEVGTAVSLAKTLGWDGGSPFHDGIGLILEHQADSSLDTLADHIGRVLGRKPSTVASGKRVGRIAIITGAGARPEWMAEARSEGADTFLSGEGLHFAKLYAREIGMNLILAGHYHTEWPAVHAVLEQIETELDIGTKLIEDSVSAGL